MDWHKTFGDVVANVIAWIVIAILTWIIAVIVARIPLLRNWFSKRPWAIAAAVAFLASGLTTSAMWTILKPNLAAAVLSFNTEVCPAGWAPFENARGRVIVGANPADGRNEDEHGGKLSPRILNASEGSETNTLKSEQLPNAILSVVPSKPSEERAFRAIAIDTKAPASTDVFAVTVLGPRPNFDGERLPGSIDLQTTLNGKQQLSINNMPPFTVLTICQKN
jgi:branched-subunit amino acid transport protein